MRNGSWNSICQAVLYSCCYNQLIIKNMKNFILIYSINDYADMGGGTEYCLLESISEVEEKVNELTQDTRISISFCGELRKEIKFKAIEKITKWEVDL